MLRSRSQSHANGAVAMTALILVSGAVLAVAGFLPWTSRGFGSTQSLLELSDLAGSGLIDDSWIEPLLLVPPLVGTITIVLASMLFASRDLRIDPRRLRAMAGAVLGLDLVAVVVTAGIVRGMRDMPLRAPGVGFVVATAAMTVIAVAVTALLRQPRPDRA